MSVLSHPGLSPTKPCSQAQGPGSDLQSDANSQTGDLSILDAAELDIRGNGGDHEELDHRYYRRPDAKKFFVVGRVFAMLWHESAGDKKGGHLNQAGPFNVQRNSKKEGKYNEEVFIHIRRMVVVKALHGHCWCVPINAFNYNASNATRFEQSCRTIAVAARPFDEEMDLGTDIGNPADKVFHRDDYMWNCV
jgi:hypothetical protein